MPLPRAKTHGSQVSSHLGSACALRCHPLANVPRWSIYRSPFAVQRVVLPAMLESLAEVLCDLPLRIAKTPRSEAQLRALLNRSAAVLDAQWVRRLALTWCDLERLAASAWVLVDLETAARLLRAPGRPALEVVTHLSPRVVFGARVEYADVPTRGFALLDVFPYATLDDHGRFSVRVIHMSSTGSRQTKQVGLCPLLSCRMPRGRRRGGWLAAASTPAGGRLIATDLPWMVAGAHGRLVAPRLAVHLLQAHLAGSCPDHRQYWNRGDVDDTLVRDIAELAVHYPPLRPVRWLPGPDGLARLGLAVPALRQPAQRQLLVCTGRIDRDVHHDGSPAARDGEVPAEPMMIFMKWLAREARERTPWACRFLAGQSVVWQFDSAAGHKYAALYEAADLPAERVCAVAGVVIPGAGGSEPACGVAPRCDAARRWPSSFYIGRPPRRAGSGPTLRLPHDGGPYGDRAFEFQDLLTSCLRELIESREPG